MDLIIVLSTVPDADTGSTIARTLVEERLAACVSIVPALRSIYRWKGVIQDDTESLLVVKTQASLFEKLRARIAQLHPYEVAEIVGLSPVACHEPYARWVLDVTGWPGRGEG